MPVKCTNSMTTVHYYMDIHVRIINLAKYVLLKPSSHLIPCKLWAMWAFNHSQKLHHLVERSHSNANTVVSTCTIDIFRTNLLPLPRCLIELTQQVIALTLHVQLLSLSLQHGSETKEPGKWTMPANRCVSLVGHVAQAITFT